MKKKGRNNMENIEDLKRQIKILEKKLEMSQWREERLCGNHKAKMLGHKSGCIACDVESYLLKK
jgi:hypothetical protein